MTGATAGVPVNGIDRDDVFLVNSEGLVRQISWCIACIPGKIVKSKTDGERQLTGQLYASCLIARRIDGGLTAVQ